MLLIRREPDWIPPETNSLLSTKSFIIRENRLKRVEVVALCEFPKGFIRQPVAQISFQHFFQRGLQFIDADAAEDLASDRLARSESAAHENVITFAAAGMLHRRGKQANVAHIMLRAGMRAAGQMNVDR